MAHIVWQTVAKEWCDLMKCAVDLMEERVYPAGMHAETGGQFRVRARKCSLGVACNLAGYSCRWAFTNPSFDGLAELAAGRAAVGGSPACDLPPQNHVSR